MKNLDQNIITWAVVSTITAKTSKFRTALKKGNFAITAMGKHVYFSHYANIENAKLGIENLKNKGTHFSVMYISDKQFGEMQIFYSK